MTTGFPVSPLTPATFLLVGLANVDLADHQRKTIPYAFAVTHGDDAGGTADRGDELLDRGDSRPQNLQEARRIGGNPLVFLLISWPSCNHQRRELLRLPLQALQNRGIRVLSAADG